MGRKRGFTLMEILVSLALFGVFLYVAALLTAEMRGYEARLPVDFLSHPQTAAVVARMRRDVLDAFPPYYENEYDKYTNGPQCLIIDRFDESTGGERKVVWDLTIPGEAHRHEFNVGAQVSEWVARGVPQFKINDYDITAAVSGSSPDVSSTTAGPEPSVSRPVAVRLQAVDSHGKLAIDEILQPRAHH